MHYVKHLRDDSKGRTVLSSSVVSSVTRGARLDMLALTPRKSVTKVETLSRTGVPSPCQSEAIIDQWEDTYNQTRVDRDKTLVYGLRTYSMNWGWLRVTNSTTHYHFIKALKHFFDNVLLEHVGLMFSLLLPTPGVSLSCFYFLGFYY